MHYFITPVLNLYFSTNKSTVLLLHQIGPQCNVISIEMILISLYFDGQNSMDKNAFICKSIKI